MYKKIMRLPFELRYGKWKYELGKRQNFLAKSILLMNVLLSACVIVCIVYVCVCACMCVSVFKFAT